MRVPALNPGDGRTAVLHSDRCFGPFRVTCKSYRSDFERGWHEHDAAGFDFVVAGTGMTRFQRGELVAGAGELWFCPSELRQLHRSGAAGMRCMHVAYLPGQLQWPGRSRGAPGKLESPAAAGRAFSILAALAALDASTSLEIESHAQELVAMAARDDLPPVKAKALDRARMLLNEVLCEPIGLQTLADHCGLSAGRLAVSFRAAYGMTAGEYHRRVRVMDAIRRLARGDEPVAHIAIATGFYDQAHLTRVMRALFGDTPARFRRVLRDHARTWARETGFL